MKSSQNGGNIKENQKKNLSGTKKILSGRAARGSTSAPFLSESSAFLSRCTRRASRRTRLTGPRVPCESSLKALYNQLANSKLVGWTLYHISNWQPHIYPCCNSKNLLVCWPTCKTTPHQRVCVPHATPRRHGQLPPGTLGLFFCGMATDLLRFGVATRRS